MKHLFLLLMLCSFTANAQDPDFWIGAWGVSPHWDATVRNVYPVRGALHLVPPPPMRVLKPDHF
ncbi:MAG: hypothetical protein WAV84_09160 [Bacteroidota bacterium]